MSGLIVTEAHEDIGFGHLTECLCIAEELADTDFDWCLTEASEAAHALLRRNGFGESFSLDTVRSSTRYDWILMDTRKNALSLQQKLAGHTDRLAVLDELGDKTLHCDMLVNFSLDPEWTETYAATERTPLLHTGPKYYPLRSGLKQAKTTGAPVPGSVLITLGGVDRTHSTLRVARALTTMPDSICTYVIGPGSSLPLGELEQVLQGHDKHRVVVAPDDFDTLMATHEFILCAGGNTLFEANYLGARGVVVWEDPHEKRQGDIFEKLGAACVVGSPHGINSKKLQSILHGKSSQAAPPSLVDGNGAERVAILLTEPSV